MLKVDFNKEFRFLPGENPEGLKADPLNVVLSFILAKSDDTRNPIKLWQWAVKLSADGILETDKTDLAMLRDVIITNKMLFAAAKGQLVELIDAVKE